MGSWGEEIWGAPAEGEPSAAELLADSIMFNRPQEQDAISPAMFGNLDDLAMMAPAAKGLLGLAALGMVKPVVRPAAALIPQFVKQSQARIVEPIINDAVKITFSPESQMLAAQAASPTSEELLALVRALSLKK